MFVQRVGKCIVEHYHLITSPLNNGFVFGAKGGLEVVNNLMETTLANATAIYIGLMLVKCANMTRASFVA